MNVSELQMSTILVDPTKNCRANMSPESLEDLAASIKKHGLQQPVIVRATSNGFELVAGYRRYAAHELLKRDTISAVVTDVDDAQRSIVNIVENVAREDLTPFETAKAFTILRDTHGLSAEKIASRFPGQRGRSAPNVRNLMRAHDNLHPSLLEQWAAGAAWATWANVMGMSSWTHDEQLAWVAKYPDVKAGRKVPTKPSQQGAEPADPNAAAPAPADRAPRAKSRNLKEIDEQIAVFAALEKTPENQGILAALEWCAGKMDEIVIVA